MTRWSVRSFPCSELLASLARSAALTRSLALLTHSLPGSWDIGIFLSHFLSVLNHCDQQNPFISHPPNHFSQSKNFMSYSSIIFCFHIPRVASASAYAFASAFASLAYFSPPSQAEFDFFPPHVDYLQLSLLISRVALVSASASASHLFFASEFVDCFPLFTRETSFAPKTFLQMNSTISRNDATS